MAEVRAVPGTGQAQGQIVGVAELVTGDGVFIHLGPTYAYSWPASAALSPFRLVAGLPPAAPGEVVVDRATALGSGLAVGAAVRVSIGAKAFEPARVTGLVAPRPGGDLAGAAAVFVAGSWAQQLLGINGRWDLVEVASARR